MGFKLGAIIGFAAGCVVAAKASDERRQQLDDALQRVRDNPRVRHVTEVVSRDARRLGDAVESRFADTADSVAETVATTVGPGSSAGSDTPASSGKGGDKTGKATSKK
ncbi:MAG TPA: YtxH domain-containing protein [Acidimicrobiales bacterium]|nr:YtxH domain-containing protein [Acidimicrobiales bacterium]